MDAAQYLKRQGWRGEGHALSHTGNGIKKPLLVSKKVDVLGVGLNKHAAVSDQWWMRAFDQGLKDLGTGKKSVLGSVREKGMSYGGLYGRFVKGESIAGTFSDSDSMIDTQVVGTKRKRRLAEDDILQTSHSPMEKRRKADDILDLKKQRKLEKGMKSKVQKDPSVKDSASKQNKRINKQAKAFVDVAAERGMIPVSKKAKHERCESVDEVAFQEVVKSAGLDINPNSKSYVEQAKYDKTEIRRKVEQCARAYLLAQLPLGERRRIEKLYEQEKVQAKAAKQAEKETQEAVAKVEGSAKREAKRSRRAEKQAGDADEGDSAVETIQGDARNTTLEAGKLDFVVDTIGDAILGNAEAALGAIVVADDSGNVRRTFQPGEVIPLEKSIWDGIKPKNLPPPVRRARQEYMAKKREARDLREANKKAKKPIEEATKSKGERKIEAREKLVTQILAKMRQAQKESSETGTVTIENMGPVKLIKIESENGPFSKAEMASARTVAKSLLKQEKRRKEEVKKANKKKTKSTT